MAAKEPTLIDGFASVQAVRRAGKPNEARLRHSATRLPETEAKPTAPAAAPISAANTRIGQTAVPQKHDLVCYECLYAFRVSGKIHYTFCPKCKRNLDMSDHVVSGAWDTEVRTMGAIEVVADAVVGAVRLRAQNIVVGGDARQATLEATRRLELAPGGLVDWRTCSMQDIWIRPDTMLVLKEPLTARQFVIAGTLRGSIRADECVTIRAGATVTGSLVSPRLVMEDGAFLKAAMALGAAPAAAARHAA